MTSTHDILAAEAAAGAERRVVWSGGGAPVSDGAGVQLNRIIGQPRLPDLDPFLLLDEFASDDPGAYIAGFPSHPHRGFETVTYMLAGRMRHRDNAGNEGLLGPGSVQWMTAGRGIVHSEMPEQAEGRMQGFQLWVNLPAKDKLTAPRYQDIAAERVPIASLGAGASARVLVGELAGVRGPVDPGATAPMFFDVSLAPGGLARIATPAGHAAFVYVFEGEASVGEPARTLARGALGVLSAGEVTHLGSAAGGRLIFVAGRPLREPIAKAGPFVMNTEAELHQAFQDLRAGRF
ncbi:MAG TPA: pirin family protein [Caulobacteraceae bacterium]|nr:pirin family protein [Caulobacteraceae bacterium]